jgi:hypothetical protein
MEFMDSEEVDVIIFCFTLWNVTDKCKNSNYVTRFLRENREVKKKLFCALGVRVVST